MQGNLHNATSVQLARALNPLYLRLAGTASPTKTAGPILSWQGGLSLARPIVNNFFRKSVDKD